MDREIIHLNKRLSRKWDEKMEIERWQRIQQATKTIDNSSPAQFAHLENNQKRQYQKEERKIEIEKNNKLLIQKMTEIIKNKETFQQRNLIGIQSVSPHGRFFVQRLSLKTPGSILAIKKSLNAEKRFRDHQNIAKENQAFLNRLQGQQSNFNVLKWRKQEKQRQKLLEQLKDYKFDEERRHRMNMEFAKLQIDQNLNGSKSIISLRNKSNISQITQRPLNTSRQKNDIKICNINMSKTTNVFTLNQQTDEQVAHTDRIESNTIRSKTVDGRQSQLQKNKQFTNYQNRKRSFVTPKSQNISYELPALKNLINQGKQKNKRYNSRKSVILFQIEIEMKVRDMQTRLDTNNQILCCIRLIYSQHNILKIRANVLENGDQYQIEVKGKDKIQNILNQFDNQYLHLIDHLRIMGDVLVLLNPKPNQQ